MKANHDVAQYLSLGGEFFNGVKKIVGIGTKESLATKRAGSSLPTDIPEPHSEEGKQKTSNSTRPVSIYNLWLSLYQGRDPQSYGRLCCCRD